MLTREFYSTSIITSSSSAGGRICLRHPQLIVLGTNDPVSLSRRWTELNVLLAGLRL